MNLRVVIPLIVLAIAAFFGVQEYQNCNLTLPGINSPMSCVTPTTKPTPVASAPQPAPSTNTQPPVTITPVAPTPPTGSITNSPVEANMIVPNVDPAINLRPERAAILEAYKARQFADAMAKGDEWLNSRPTDALIAITRSNASQRLSTQPFVTIGVSVPTSGASIQAGEAILQGINMAIQEVNRAGGIRNRRVLVEVKNDQNDRTQAIQAASALVEDRDVLGVIGPVNSSSSLAASDIYNNSSLVHLLPTATDDRLSNAGSWTYRLAPTNAAQGRALARIVKQRGFTRIPVYSDPNDAYSKSLADAFTKEALIQGISAIPFAFSKGELPTQQGFDIFNDSPRPNAAFIAGAYQDVARIAKAIRTQDIQVPLIAGDAAYSQTMLQEGGSAVEGLTLLSFFHSTAGIANTASFVKSFAARYGGGTPNARAAQAYDATRALLEAIKRAPALNRAGIKTALDTITSIKPSLGVTSPVAFNKGSIQGKPFVVIEVKSGRLEAAGTIK